MRLLRAGSLCLACAVLPAWPVRAQTPRVADTFTDAIVQPDLAVDEREKPVEPKPEIFLQARFSRGPIAGSEPDEAVQNFQMTRVETRWSGAVTARIGVGFELQFQPLLEGVPEEIVNDAFLDFYATKGLTIRVGQFIKPFGFDIQQSSSDREYPERAMSVGYFFPGQRDRGLMAMWHVDSAKAAVGHLQLYGALLNGNRFFNDNDGRVDVVVRARRLLLDDHLAFGASFQIGSELVPPGIVDDGDVRIGGADVQYSVRRVGVRAEWVHGTRPSTLLSLEPVFTSAFTPGSTTTGVSAALIVRRTANDQIYARIDRLTGDPMTGQTLHAADVGYRRTVGGTGNISFDYQYKSAPTSNDDEVNTRFQITLGLGF